uniref:Cyclin-like domain-containing protein n=1 Tax=Aegilops tauschii subsp. strangulata TaxID=200361 RepID=A0A453EIM5_AEGTS
RKRPSTDFLETIQKDVNPSMRAILIDWLVEVAEEYRLVPDTLYLTVNYIDRYLSGNEINRQRLQLLGVACMLIAAKYEEICAPQVEEFCYITDNTYFKDEVLDMEASVLNYLKFEMTAPTAKCFLRRFVRAAQVCDEGSTFAS